MFVVASPQKADPEGWRSARDILSSRAAEGIWPLNIRTSHQRHLAAGDEILFYAAGKSDPDRGSIIARAVIAGERMPIGTMKATSSAWLGLEPKTQFGVPIREVRWLDRGVPIRALVQRLDFIRNKSRWGTALQGGVVEISPNDFETILTSAAPYEHGRGGS